MTVAALSWPRHLLPEVSGGWGEILSPLISSPHAGQEFLTGSSRGRSKKALLFQMWKYTGLV